MERTARASGAGWLWYAVQTPNCAPLDPTAYPSTFFDGEPVPWPSWVCKAPDGGMHIHANTAVIDVHLVKPPDPRDDVSWTCDYGVLLVRTGWLSGVADLIDEEHTFVGAVYVGGEKLEDWATLNGRATPPLLSSQGSSKACPICGSVYSLLRGRAFFTDRSLQAQPLFVNSKGVFLREDLAAARDLPTPRGAFKPTIVRLERGRTT